MSNKSSPRFYSLLFVIPKKNGKLSLVVDLRALNRHFFPEKFHIETQSNLHQSIQKGDWLISVDLPHAYLNIPIRPASKKYLRFMYQKEIFQFRVLPLGLSVSQRVLTRVMDAMMAHVQ